MTTVAPLTPLRSPEEASPFVGFSPRTLRDKAGAGEIPHTRAGSRIWFSDEDIAAIRAMNARRPERPAAVVLRSRTNKRVA